MMEFLQDYRLLGLVIGISTFLIIGLFHPVVIKAEYYWGARCWWLFMDLGVVGTICSLLTEDVRLDGRVGVTGFPSLWHIHVVF